jgi:hypothetical protein
MFPTFFTIGSAPENLKRRRETINPEKENKTARFSSVLLSALCGCVS